jgi:antitoxin (DNA-binding transcriptional repressor) of toxin-antitoxin stability system
LRRTKEGEEIVVTERGTPIAVIQPLASTDSTKKMVSLEARLAALAAQGKLRLPARKPLQRVSRATVTGKPLSRVVAEERDELF